MLIRKLKTQVDKTGGSGIQELQPFTLKKKFFISEAQKYFIFN